MDERHYLPPLFVPQSVAAIGAAARTGVLGAIPVHNRPATRYKGALLPVNPKYKPVRGAPCFHDDPPLSQ